MSALRRVKKVKGGYEVTVKCTGTPMQTRVFGSYQECEVFADDYFFDYLGVQLKCAHHPEGDGVEPEGLNPDSLETVEIEIPMNERLKELAEQVGATIHKAMHGEAISFLENDLERFAELVRQDYLRELKALKPLGYIDSKGVLFNNTTHPHLNTPLYALDEVKHD